MAFPRCPPPSRQDTEGALSVPFPHLGDCRLSQGREKNAFRIPVGKRELLGRLSPGAVSARPHARSLPLPARESRDTHSPAPLAGRRSPLCRGCSEPGAGVRNIRRGLGLGLSPLKHLLSGTSSELKDEMKTFTTIATKSFQSELCTPLPTTPLSLLCLS